MHIADGILSWPVLATGAAASAAGVGVGLWRIRDERIPEVALLSAALFVVSLIHLPVPPTSVHLLLNGLAGVLLGWAVFPAVLVALLLQAWLGFGGLTALGVNAFVIGAPAVVCHYAFRLPVGGRGAAAMVARGAVAGALGVFLSGLLLSLALVTTGKGFLLVAWGAIVLHVPVAAIEAAVTAAAVGFLLKVKPELLQLAAAGRIGEELADA